MQVKGWHMKKIFLLFICFLNIGSIVFGNSLNVYASDDESNITITSSDQFFSYSFAGMTYTSNISLDDAWNNAMKSQYELGNLGLNDIEIEYGLYNSSAINHIVPNENSRSSSRNPEEDGIKVHLEWQPTSNGNYIPLKYMKVQLYYIYYNNDSPLTSIVLEEGYTDDNGNYVFTDILSWKELLHPVSGIIDMFNGIELRVRICPEGKTFKIQKDWLNILNLAGEVLTDWSIVNGIIEEFLSYSVITNSINVGYFDRNGDFGTIQIPYGIKLNDTGGLVESNVLNRSFKIAQSLAMGQKFINEQGIDITNKVNVAYPAFYGSDMDTNAFCYYDYNLQSGLMCIGGLRDPMSRLDYDWYSNNENVAVVSQYGTVLAKPVDSNTIVTIYAVLKKDPSVVYRATFTILNDTSEEIIEIECNMSYSFSEKNGYYNFELNDSNCPYPMIQYYDWIIFVPCQENDISVTMGAWGYITASGPGIAIITGTYEFNPRVTIIINLSITE